VDHLKVGLSSGSCGAAAYLGSAVVVTDIETDPRWTDHLALALPLGLKACWLSPIKSGDSVIGTFAFYYRQNRGPNELEQTIVDACVHLCSIAIEREERVAERQRLTYTDGLTGPRNRTAFDLALRDECGFTGSYTIIKDYMRQRDQGEARKTPYMWCVHRKLWSFSSKRATAGTYEPMVDRVK
jgi:hypothetical protein